MLILAIQTWNGWFLILTWNRFSLRISNCPFAGNNIFFDCGNFLIIAIEDRRDDILIDFKILLKKKGENAMLFYLEL